MAFRILEWLFDNVIMWFVIVFIAFVVIGIPLAAYSEYSAEKFELRKDQWVCTISHNESSTTYVQSGSVMIPITSTSNVCEQWTSKK